MTYERADLPLADLVLRPWSRNLGGYDLLAAVAEAARDPRLALWNPIPVTDPASAGEWIDTLAARWDAGAATPFAVMDATTGGLLGAVTLRWVDRPDNLAMLGYWTVPAARERGVATRAVRAITGWGFGVAGARRIELAHGVGNEASCRVATRCGYPAEGTLRRSHRFGDGEYHDEHLHARLATDPPL
ncbi:acetyltransferase [Acrocarpospora corrugata]|uniref:Acetyltransferase n=1 Tax=Acrocarpospora corrugata TaxID=35763 RepID=A0A5M3VVN3_9ACTN|nr:GNAT family protein [Acrocarpospora corrugata]GES00867.1 acetyltransferase [Acrocarpospora corrugata]